MDKEWSRALLSYFPSISPKVEHIGLKMERAKEYVRIDDIRPILGCIHLRSLVCEFQISDMKSAAVELSQLPNLETLSLTFEGPDGEDSSPPPTPSVFRCLKSLTCDFPEFFQACHFPMLQSFSTTDTWGIHDLLTTLLGHCSPELLHEIKIVSEDYKPTRTEFLGGTRSYLTKEGLQGLLAFRALKRLVVEVVGCEWGDQELELLASAWPGLTELTILPIDIDVGDDIGFKFTLPGLAHLVRHCPDLALLSISIGKPDLPIPLTDLPDAGCSNLHLEAVEFCGPDIKTCQCDATAAFLYCLFPNLRRIEPHGDEDFKLQRPGWERVEELVRLFRTVRTHTQRGH